MIKYFLFVSHIMYFLRFWSCYGFFFLRSLKVLWDFFHLFVGLKGTLFSFLGYQGDFLHTFGRIFLNFWGARGFFFFFLDF
jgi:hypothetical protein